MCTSGQVARYSSSLLSSINSGGEKVGRVGTHSHLDSAQLESRDLFRERRARRLSRAVLYLSNCTILCNKHSTKLHNGVSSNTQDKGHGRGEGDEQMSCVAHRYMYSVSLLGIATWHLPDPFTFPTSQQSSLNFFDSLKVCTNI